MGRVSDRRSAFCAVTAAYLTAKNALVVLEDLKTRTMTASASGTFAAPGTCVVQKRGLNRTILDKQSGATGACPPEEERRTSRSVPCSDVSDATAWRYADETLEVPGAWNLACTKPRWAGEGDLVIVDSTFSPTITAHEAYHLQKYRKHDMNVQVHKAPAAHPWGSPTQHRVQTDVGVGRGTEPRFKTEVALCVDREADWCNRVDQVHVGQQVALSRGTCAS
jgi:hypothetical protein